MRTIKFNGCKHLDYGDNYVGCVKKQVMGLYVYWKRDDRWEHDEVRKSVQFCKKRGRLNCKSSCITECYAECSDYENVIHEVEVPE